MEKSRRKQKQKQQICLSYEFIHITVDVREPFYIFHILLSNIPDCSIPGE